MSESQNLTQTTGGLTYTATITGDSGSHTINLPADFFQSVAVKAVGDWRLDVLVVPFGSRSNSDSDEQWFDDATDIMHEAFPTPLVIYQHGVKKGARGMEDKPIVIGDSVLGSLNKQPDGWHVLVDLRPKVKEAADVMAAAWKRMVAVSSDSISHLARLEIGGKLINYEKNRPGRIAVWPLAGFSLWEMGNGNFKPANHSAFALPAMKAMYREAGIPFPDGVLDTHGVLSYAPQVEAAKRAKVKAIKERSKQILKRIKG